MNSEQTADNVKRLREIEAENLQTVFPDKTRTLAIQTINSLVDLVGEMREEIKYIKKLLPDHSLITFPNFNFDIEGACYRALNKSAPIAALKEKV